jgi:hypothetical protein
MGLKNLIEEKTLSTPISPHQNQMNNCSKDQPTLVCMGTCQRSKSMTRMGSPTERLKPTLLRIILRIQKDGIVYEYIMKSGSSREKELPF